MDDPIPKYKDLYKLLKKVDFVVERELDNEETNLLNRKESVIYHRAKKNGYIDINEYESYSLKKEFKEKVKFDKEYGELTLEGGEVPMQRYNIDSIPIIEVTNKGEIFLENYSRKLDKVEYLAKEYPFLIPTISGFLGGIISSVLLYLIIGR